MPDYSKLKTPELIMFKQTCIEKLLDLADLSRTESDADNRYALEARRGELLQVLRLLGTELGRRGRTSS